MRSIYVLLTRSPTLLSKTIHIITDADYTHAAIAFDRRLTTLCSFGRKFSHLPYPGGLVRESIYLGFYREHPYTPCVLLELRVADETFNTARREVLSMLCHSGDYRYSVRGLALCGRGVAEDRDGYFFCSQFVAEIISRSGAASLPKIPSLMNPVDFEKMPCFQAVYRGDVGALRRRILLEAGIQTAEPPVVTGFPRPVCFLLKFLPSAR